jgi:hypothetical protein
VISLALAFCFPCTPHHPATSITVFLTRGCSSQQEPGSCSVTSQHSRISYLLSNWFLLLSLQEAAAAKESLATAQSQASSAKELLGFRSCIPLPHTPTPPCHFNDCAPCRRWQQARRGWRLPSRRPSQQINYTFRCFPLFFILSLQEAAAAKESLAAAQSQT